MILYGWQLVQPLLAIILQWPALFEHQQVTSVLAVCMAIEWIRLNRQTNYWELTLECQFVWVRFRLVLTLAPTLGPWPSILLHKPPPVSHRMQQIAVHAVSVPESPMSIYWLDWALNIVIESLNQASMLSIISTIAYQALSQLLVPDYERNSSGIAVHDLGDGIGDQVAYNGCHKIDLKVIGELHDL